MVNDRSTFSLRLLHVYGGVLKQPPRPLHQRQYLRDARRAETFSVVSISYTTFELILRSMSNALEL